MKKLYTVTLGILVLLLMAASASAATTKELSNGAYASAEWDITNDYGTLYAYIDAYDSSNYGTEAYVSVYGYDANGIWHDFWGYATIPDDAFKAKNINFASLSEVTFNVYDYTTDSYRPVTIKADWTAVGGDKEVDKYSWKDKESSYKAMGTYKDATATGSIIDFDGHELIGEETSDYGFIETYKSMYMEKNVRTQQTPA